MQKLKMHGTILIMVVDEKLFRSIPPSRRQLYLRVVDTYQDYHLITRCLFFLNEHFPTEKLDAALRWLIHNGIVGSEFVRWYSYSCKKSDLEMHRVLLAVINYMKNEPIVAGRNFRL